VKIEIVLAVLGALCVAAMAGTCTYVTVARSAAYCDARP
jgi:hypothetical protein